MGKKYVIELEDKAFSQSALPLDDDEMLYRVKGFRSLVFDQNGLDKLTPLKDEIKEYQTDGYARAGMLKEAYDRGYAQGLIQGKVDARTETETIRVGDEVEVINSGNKYVIAWIDRLSYCGFSSDGVTCVLQADDVRKTGRHFDEVEKLLEAMRE